MTAENVGDEELVILITELLPVEVTKASVAQGQSPGPVQKEVLFEQEVELPSKNVNLKVRRLTFPVGFKTPEHSHKAPGPRYVLNGKVEVVEDGETHIYTAGETFWEYSTPMTAENVGDGELVVLITELLPVE